MGVATRVALSALAVLLLQLGAASARSLQTTSKEYIVKHDKHHGNICAFKADKQYSIHEFTTAFSIKWELVLELNEEWCEDRHIEHVPKGSLWYLPCDQHCAHIAHWHWKAEEKRSWKGDACLYKLDKDEHPRWVAYLFEVDWDVCLQLNPWVASRDKCEREETLWIPCYLKHKEKKEQWHYSKEHIPCDFSKPEPVHPPACPSHCPGHWPKWWNKPWCQKKDYKWEECKHKYWCPEDKHYEDPLACCKHDPHCSEHCPKDDDNTGAPEPWCCKKDPHCSDKCHPVDDDDNTGNAPSTAPPSSPSPSPAAPPTQSEPADPPVESEPATPPTPADDDDEEVPAPPADDDVPSPPADDDVPSPPADDDVPSPPADDDVPSPPADDDVPAPPADDDVPAPPADDDVPAPPADDDVPAPPADDDVPAPPADDDVPAPPADDDGALPEEEDSGDTSGIP